MQDIFFVCRTMHCHGNHIFNKTLVYILYVLLCKALFVFVINMLTRYFLLNFVEWNYFHTFEAIYIKFGRHKGLEVYRCEHIISVFVRQSVSIVTIILPKPYGSNNLHVIQTTKVKFSMFNDLEVWLCKTPMC